MAQHWHHQYGNSNKAMKMSKANRFFGVLRAVSLAVVLACAAFVPVQAQDPIVSRYEVQSAVGVDRILLHSDAALPYKSFLLDNPPRLVIDMPALNWKAGEGLPAGYRGQVLQNIRVGRFNPTTTRMVLDLAQNAGLYEVNLRNQGGAMPFLMVFDVAVPGYKPSSAPQAAATPVAKPSAPAVSAPTPAEIRNSTAKPAHADATNWAEFAEEEAKPKPLPEGLPFAAVPVPVFKPEPERKPIVVIDAGHGGRDPGATGVKGTREKNVTLGYAQALGDALRRTGRYEVHLTRNDDVYIMLRERLAIGRRHKGDIFISVHADSAENHATRGLSIYTLSETASDKEAAALAARENKVDIIYGMNLSQENKDVTEILIDLAQRETKNKSTKLADILVEAVGRKVQLLPNTHRYAGFAVLKAPDVPSVLIELGFLSNRKDEALITSSNYRQQVVDSLVQGIDNYFAYQKSKQ